MRITERLAQTAAGWILKCLNCDAFTDAGLLDVEVRTTFELGFDGMEMAPLLGVCVAPGGR